MDEFLSIRYCTNPDPYFPRIAKRNEGKLREKERLWRDPLTGRGGVRFAATVYWGNPVDWVLIYAVCIVLAALLIARAQRYLLVLFATPSVNVGLGWVFIVIHKRPLHFCGNRGTGILIIYCSSVVVVVVMYKWIFENILVITPPENRCDSRAPHGLPRRRGGATSNPHSSPITCRRMNGCRAQFGERGASLLRE